MIKRKDYKVGDKFYGVSFQVNDRLEQNKSLPKFYETPFAIMDADCFLDPIYIVMEVESISEVVRQYDDCIQNNIAVSLKPLEGNLNYIRSIDRYLIEYPKGEIKDTVYAMEMNVTAYYLSKDKKPVPVSIYLGKPRYIMEVGWYFTAMRELAFNKESNDMTDEQIVNYNKNLDRAIEMYNSMFPNNKLKGREATLKIADNKTMKVIEYIVTQS